MCKRNYMYSRCIWKLRLILHVIAKILSILFSKISLAVSWAHKISEARCPGSFKILLSLPLQDQNYTHALLCELFKIDSGGGWES